MATIIYAHPILTVIIILYIPFLVYSLCLYYQRCIKPELGRSTPLGLFLLFVNGVTAVCLTPWIMALNSLFFRLPYYITRMGVQQKIANIIVHSPLFAVITYILWIIINFLTEYTPIQFERAALWTVSFICSIWFNIIFEIIWPHYEK